MPKPKERMPGTGHGVAGRPQRDGKRATSRSPSQGAGSRPSVTSRSPDSVGVTLPDDVDVLVVGAGHAGLVMSGLLTEAGREHVVVERRDRLGGGWRDRGTSSCSSPELDGVVSGVGLRRPRPGRLHGARGDRRAGGTLRRRRGRTGGARHGGAAARSGRRSRFQGHHQPGRRHGPAGRRGHGQLPQAPSPAGPGPSPTASCSSTPTTTAPRRRCPPAAC